MTTNKIILGFVGPLASGKGTSASYLKEKYAANTHRFSTMLRDMLDRIYLDKSRDNLIKMSEAIREKFGEDIMAKAMAGDAKKDPNNIVVIDGIRRPADIEYLSQNPDFILVAIDADIEKRYERIIKRGENADDKSKTFEEFQADHQRSTEVTIPGVMAEADENIDNNGSLQELYSQLDKLVNKYR
ncbi:MAG: AAA family ATPase [Candidatus Magasanikbacteria bacterium]|nr:AAA family ATPase [Candidatus Magasanikbacteria bacterium]